MGVLRIFQKFLEKKSHENVDTLQGEIGNKFTWTTFGLISPKTEKKMYWWGVPGLGLAGVNDFLNLFLLYYYNQILGLSAALAGIALFISVVFDAVSDPVIAYWSDRHNGKFGRRIPFMFMGVIPMSFCCLLLFLLHLGEEQWVLFAQLTVLIVFFRISQTIFAVPRFALGVELYKDYSKRNQLIGTDRIFEIFGTALCLGPIMLLMPDWDQGSLYPWAAVWVAFLLGWSAYLGTVKLSAVERNYLQLDRAGKAADFSVSMLLREVRSLIDNKNWMTLLVAFLFFSVNGRIQSSDSIYLNNFLFKFDPRDLFWAGPLQLGGGAITALLTWRIATGRNKRNLVLIAGGLSFIVNPLLIGLMALDYYFGYNMIPDSGGGVLSPLWWIWAFHGFLNGAIWTFFIILVVSMFADVVEDHQASTGSRSDGLVLVGRNLVTKLVASVGVLFAGFMIQWAGFDEANTIELKEVAVYKFVVIKIAISSLLVPLALLCLSRYSLTEDQHLANLTQLGYENGN